MHFWPLQKVSKYNTSHRKLYPLCDFIHAVTPQLRQLLQKPSACHKPSDLKRPHLQWQQVTQSSGPVRSLLLCQKRCLFSVRCACKVRAVTAAGSRAWPGQHLGIYWHPKGRSRLAQAQLSQTCLFNTGSLG